MMFDYSFGMKDLLLHLAPVYNMAPMAPKFDFDLIIAGEGVLALALGRMAAFRKLDVLLIPPVEKIPSRKDSFFFSQGDLNVLKELGLPGNWENSRISDGGVFRKGLGDTLLPEEFRYILGAEVLERAWDVEENQDRLKKEEGLEIKAVREADGAVVLEGLSPRWSFTYRCRFLAVLSNHRALKTLLDLPEPGPTQAWSLCGDFENYQDWSDTYRSEASPQGALETWLVGKNTRRFVFPLDKPKDPYVTEMLRETIPPLTGAPLDEKRRVAEHLWTLPENTEWVFRKGRYISLQPEGCTFAGLPGSNSILSGLAQLVMALAWSRRAPVKVLDYLDQTIQEINRQSSRIRRVWMGYQVLQVRKKWFPALLRRIALGRTLTKMTRLSALPGPTKEMKK